MLPRMVVVPVNELPERSVSSAVPVLTKSRAPVIEPAKSLAALTEVLKVAAETLVMMPPAPGRTPALERAPTVWELPFRSRTAPELTTSASALELVPVPVIAAPVLNR